MVGNRNFKPIIDIECTLVIKSWGAGLYQQVQYQDFLAHDYDKTI